MKQLVLTLRCELDIVQDSLASIRRAHEALAKRHGDAFRQLERDIEALRYGGPLMSPEPIDLGGGFLLFTPSTDLTALIQRAKGLGVI